MKKIMRLSERQLSQIVAKVLNEQKKGQKPGDHPIDNPLYQEMTRNVEGENVEIVSYQPNKLVIDAFGNIYTIIKGKS